MTPQQLIKSRFMELTDSEAVRVDVRNRKGAFYVTVFADFGVSDRLVHRICPHAWMTSGAPFDQTYRLPDEAVAQFLQEMTIQEDWLAWNNATVPKIAQGIRNERAFANLPILADALEDAGCTNQSILFHCRSNADHIQSCWVIDLLLGPVRTRRPSSH